MTQIAAQLRRLILNALPVLLMILLVPLVRNDWLLTAIYVGIIAVSLLIKRDRRDWVVLLFGFAVMTVVEYVFVSTGVEAFRRNSLFGLMPVWLPFLWAYGFVAIKRLVLILSE